MKDLYQSNIVDFVHFFKSNIIAGLSSHQIKEYRALYGRNKRQEASPDSFIIIFFKRCASPLVYLLLTAAVIIYFFSDNSLNAIIIAGILIFNTLIIAIQEWRAQHMLVSLKSFLPDRSVVIRDHEKRLIDSSDLVPGDIIIVHAGEHIPADAQIIEAYDVIVNQAPLTGESEPVAKSAPILGDGAQDARANMLYSGTIVISGWAKALVVAIGNQTEIAGINKKVPEIKKTAIPLMHEITRLSWGMVYAIVIIGLMLLILGLITGQPLSVLVTLTALFMCAMPERLLRMLTLALTKGIYRMAQENVVVNNVDVIETFGRVQAMIIDKIGTLTRNEMIVTHVWTDDIDYTISGKGYYQEGSIFDKKKKVTINQQSNLYKLGHALHLLHDAVITCVSERGTFTLKGDPTHAALFVFSAKVGINASCVAEFKPLYEIPFDSSRGYQARFYAYNGSGIAFVSGSPEFIISRMASDDKIKQALHDYLAQGLRVSAVAYKNFNIDKSGQIPEKKEFFESLIACDLNFLGLCGMQDSIRPEAQFMINKVRKAGFQVVMATQDHQRTAIATAKQVGIFNEGDDAINEDELALLSDMALQQIVLDVTVFSRVNASEKLRIINALHAQKKIVAATGDSANDVPSLVTADVGIAMNSSTRVVKDAADIILLDDSLVTIVRALEEGRYILHTLKRITLYFFQTHCAQILFIMSIFILNIFVAQPYQFPLAAAHIVWLNVVMGGLLCSALALEKRGIIKQSLTMHHFT